MKRISAICLTLCMFLTLLAGCGSQSSSSDAAPAPASENSAAPTESVETKEVGTIGVAFRDFADTFVSNLRTSIKAEAAAIGATIDDVDCQRSQPMQNDKIDLFLTKGYSAMGIILQENNSGAMIIKKAKEAGNIPIVFFNHPPFEEDLLSYDNCYFVGALDEECGRMQGDIMLKYWNENKDKADKNGDGKLQYVMLVGDPASTDAIKRSEFSIKQLNDNGLETECVAEDTAGWDRVKGQEKMQAILAAQGDKIEAVFANNDDMALGAIEALKAAGYYTDDKFMPVIGVDATDPGKEAIRAGTMLGTVLNDSNEQGKATMDLLYLLAKGEKPSESNYNYKVTDNKYIWIPYSPVTKENVG